MSGTDELSLRLPTVADGAGIWDLVQQAGTLELNTAYAYLLFCKHFQDTCVVAEENGRLMGCVIGYRPPADPAAVFVWQVAVAPEARRRGLAGRMLRFLARLAPSEIPGRSRFVEASVTESNAASLRLFRSFAERLGVPCRESVFLAEDAFPESHEHEREMLLRIGPIEAGSRELEDKEIA